MHDIVVDGRELDVAPQRAIATYLRHVLAGLSARGHDVDVLVTDVARAPAGTRPRRVRRSMPARWSHREHDLRLPRELARSRATVAFSPAQEPPRTCRKPWIQTLHGLLPLVSDLPELAVERARWQRYGPRIRDAAAVVAVSRFCAEQAAELLGLDPSRLHVVHHGVDPVFRPGDHRPEGPAYVLLVAQYGPAKGYPEAFRVIGGLARAGLSHRLKVVGGHWPHQAGHVETHLRTAPRPDLVDLVGQVPPHELRQLYLGASAVIVTSRYESFGLPALEAMACGAPVVAFDNTGTAEVVADGGILIPDGDTDGMAAAVVELVRDDATAASVAARGAARAAAFTWEQSVAAHSAIIEAVA